MCIVNRRHSTHIAHKERPTLGSRSICAKSSNVHYGSYQVSGLRRCRAPPTIGRLPVTRTCTCDTSCGIGPIEDSAPPGCCSACSRWLSKARSAVAVSWRGVSLPSPAHHCADTVLGKHFATRGRGCGWASLFSSVQSSR